jgi:hypothetical protein
MEEKYTVGTQHTDVGINIKLPNFGGGEGGGGGEKEESDDHCDDDIVFYVLAWFYR